MAQSQSAILKIGSRGSPLALAQEQAALRGVATRPGTAGRVTMSPRGLRSPWSSGANNRHAMLGLPARISRITRFGSRPLRADSDERTFVVGQRKLSSVIGVEGRQP